MHIMQASKKGMVKSFDLGCEICENYVKSLSGYGSVVQFWSLTLLDVGGGPHGPTLGVISCHSVGDAPTNSKFLDFSQWNPYFHLVKQFFTFFIHFYKKITVKIFCSPKKRKIFWWKWSKTLFSQKYLHFLFQLCNQYALRNFLRCITCL